MKIEAPSPMFDTSELVLNMGHSIPAHTACCGSCSVWTVSA